MTSPPETPSERLDSWKEIAHYLGRGVRTVQRWESHAGLPVRRLSTEKRGSVFAYRREIDHWWQSRSSLPEFAETESAVSLLAPDQIEAMPSRGWRRRSVIAIIAASCVIGALGLALVWRASTPRGRSPALQRVTWDGDAVTPALSPDALLVAYATRHKSGDGALDIHILHQDGRTLATVPSSPRTSEWDPVFSRSGSRVLYSATTGLLTNPEIEFPQPGSGVSVYEYDLAARHSRLVAPNATAARYSPDGKWIACLQAADDPSPGIVLTLLSADVNSAVSRPVLLEAGDRFTAAGPPVWSPDSQNLLLNAKSRRSPDVDWWMTDVAAVRGAKTGWLAELIGAGLPDPRFMIALGPRAWLQDGRVLTASIGPAGAAMWSVRVRGTRPSLQPRSLSRELEQAANVSWASYAAGHVAFSSNEVYGTLSVVAIDLNTGRVLGQQRKVREAPGGFLHASVSADGRRLAFSSPQPAARTAVDVFAMDIATATDRVVAASPAPDVYTAINRKGTAVAFVSEASNHHTLNVAPMESGTASTLCEDCGRPQDWTPADDAIVIAQPPYPSRSIGLIRLSDRHLSTILTSDRESLTNPRLSPQGTWISFLKRSGSVVVAPFRGWESVPPSEWRTVSPDDDRALTAFWSPDGRRLYWIAATTDPETAVIRSRSVDHPQGVSAPVDVMRLRWKPGLNNRQILTVPVGANQIFLPTMESRSDVFLLRPAVSPRF